jgi:hypothetical protein
MNSDARASEANTTAMIASRKVALVGHGFFSYIYAIRDRLAERGFEVGFFDERHANSVSVKILYRLGFYSIFQARKHRHLDQIAGQVVEDKYTDVLLVDVEVCDRRFVQRLVDAGLRVHLYMWDSWHNKGGYRTYLDLLSGKASFDPSDCAEFNLQYIALFAEDVFACPVDDLQSNPLPPLDISFCGTLHSNRAQRLRKLVKFARGRKLRVQLLLYFHTRRLLLLKGVFRPSNLRFLHSISTSAFSKREIALMFARSKYVIDLPHPDQKGLTARTFEALRAGANLITFNPSAAKLPYSLPNRVVVVGDIDDMENIDLASPRVHPPLTPEEEYFLSLDRFVDQILALMGGDEPHALAPVAVPANASCDSRVNA